MEKREGKLVIMEAEDHHHHHQQQQQENGTDSKSYSMEDNKVILLRAIVENKDSSSKEVDNLTMKRFLRARDHDVERAASMLLKYLSWRRTCIPNGYISSCEVPNEVAQNKMFMQGLDKQGRPVAVILSGRHFPNKKGGLDEFKRFVAFALDRVLASMPPGQEKFVVIGDIRGWGYANMDIRAYLGGLKILQDYYPEMLGKLFLVHVPYIFMRAWKIILPFIDIKTKQKIVFVENKQLKETLLEDVDESQLPEIYGGKLPLVPIQDA